MALSGIEKIKLTGELKKLAKQITDPAVGGVAKIRLTKDIKAIRAKITGSDKKISSMLENLLAGKYSNLNPYDFIRTIRAIVDTEGVELSVVKPPTRQYVEAYLQAA